MNRNYEIIKSRYPEIYSKLESYTVYKDEIELVLSKSGHENLKILGETYYFLHSKYNPSKEADKFINGVYEEKIDKYFMIGLGLGYYAKSLLRKDSHSEVCIIETNASILKVALDNIDLVELLESPRIKLFLVETAEEFSEVFSNTIKENRSKIIINRNLLKVIPSEMDEIRYLLEEYKLKESSIKSIGNVFEENFDYNSKNYDKAANELFNKYLDNPIFIVSAGPSLDKNINQLKYIGKKGIIMAVGRAVKPLIKADVLPDFIIITDMQDFVYESQLSGLDINVPIIVLSTCDKNVIKKYKGLKYIAFQSGYTEAEDFAKKLGIETVETGGSVATTALDIAIRMGGNPIIFVGQDLAFTEDRTHSKDSASRRVKETAGLRKAIDINGNSVLTSKNLSIYRRWMESRIRKEDKIRFIDATEGGAKIEGTEIMILKDLIRKLGV